MMTRDHALNSLSSTPSPSERDPTRSFKADVLRSIVHRSFRGGDLPLAWIGWRREGRDVAGQSKRVSATQDICHTLCITARGSLA